MVENGIDGALDHVELAAVASAKAAEKAAQDKARAQRLYALLVASGLPVGTVYSWVKGMQFSESVKVLQREWDARKPRRERLSDDAVRMIVEMGSRKLGLRHIAKEVGTSIATVSRILSGSSRADVSGLPYLMPEEGRTDRRVRR